MSPRAATAVSAPVLILGGSGAYSLEKSALGVRLASKRFRTPFGLSNPLHLHEDAGFRFLFLSRHGEGGYEMTAPSVNYRANIWAAKEAGVGRIVAWTGPGSLRPAWEPGELVLPDDVIDLTRNRPSTFFEGTGLGFIRLSSVFCETVRAALLRAHRITRSPYLVRSKGLYVCTEGPRLETPAEIRMFKGMGADLVGMTLCPEAFLARELEICYAPIAYITNWAEGIRRLPYRSGELFEGMLPKEKTARVEAAKDAIPAIAIEAAKALADEPRDCPCSVSMERYRKRGQIGSDFRDWIAKPSAKRKGKE